MKPNLKFTLERPISAFGANSEAFSRNNEALRRLIHRAESGELTHEKFRALADPLITEADALQERRRELKAAYNDAMERLRIGAAGRAPKGGRKRTLSLIVMATTATVFAVGEVYAHAFEWTDQMCGGAPSLCQNRDLLALRRCDDRYLFMSRGRPETNPDLKHGICGSGIFSKPLVGSSNLKTRTDRRPLGFILERPPSK